MPGPTTVGGKITKKPTTKSTSKFQWWYDYDFLYAPILSALVILIFALVKITSFVDLSLGIVGGEDTTIFQSSLVASVGVCGPIFLELMQDISFVMVSRLIKSRALYAGKMRYFIGRTILLAALLIPSSFLLLEVQLGAPHEDRQVLFICVTFVRRIACMLAILFCMTPFQSDGTFTQFRIFGIMIFYSAAQLCEFFNINAGNGNSNKVLNAFSIIFLIISYAWICWLVLLWGVKKRLKLIAMYRSIFLPTTFDESWGGAGVATKDVKSPKSTSKVIPEEFYESGILILSFLACVASHVLDGQHSWNVSTEWGVLIPTIKAGYTYLAILFTSFMSALLGRHARIAVIIEKENKLEEKKAFIRYISHEIRTPLNTVCLGLEVLGDDLKKSVNPMDIERCETIGDIAASCQIALSILNDLLNMDKVESGTLVLEKKLESVLPFLGDAMTAFKLQAEKQQIALILDTDFRGPPERLSLSLALPGAETVRRALMLNSARTNSQASDLYHGGIQGNEMHTSASIDHLNTSLQTSFGVNDGDTSTPIDNTIDAAEARKVLTRHDRLGRGVGPDDCANIDIHKFGQVVRNLLSNALKFTKSDGVVKMRVRSVNEITLDELIETEEFQMFGKMPVWEMLNLAVINHRASATTPDVERTAESSSTDMASGGVPSLHPTVGSTIKARIRDTRQSFSKGSGARIFVSSSRDSTGCQEPEGENLQQHGKEKIPSRENEFSLSREGSRRGSAIDTGLPLSRTPSMRGDAMLEVGGGGSKENSKPTSRTESPRESSKFRGSLDSIVSSVTQEATRMIVIEVIDSGVGLTADILPRIFNEVLQVNPGELQQGGGSGLGLMLTKGIVDQHGGKISVYSAGPNTGCTFTILLPLFKIGNQQIEEKNREEVNTFSRRVFINKFLEQTITPNRIISAKPSVNDLSLDVLSNAPTNMKPRLSFPNHAQTKVMPGNIRRNTAFDQLGAYIMRNIAEVDDETESVDNHVPAAGLSISGRGEDMSLFDGEKNETGWAWRSGIGSRSGPSTRTGGLSPKTGPSPRTLSKTQGTAGGGPSATNLITQNDLEGGGADGGGDSEKGDLGEMPIVPRPHKYSTMLSNATQLERMKAVSNLCILVVDDSTLNRKMLVKLLEGRGHVCDEARNGQDATNKVEVQLIELRRRIEAQKSQAGSSKSISDPSNLLKTIDSARSSSIEHDQANSSKKSRNSSFRDGKEGDQAIRTSSLRLPPLEHRGGGGTSPSKSSTFSKIGDRFYDVIMLDQMMPVMDGPTAAAEMRALGFTGFIVGVTGNVLAADTQYFKSRGANHVLGKPLNMDMFNKAVRDYASNLA